MAKEKQDLFSDLQFDSAAYAQDVITASQTKLEKVSLGLKIGAVATVFSVIMFLTSGSSKLTWLSNLCFVICIVGAIAAYVIGGGFGNAVGLAAKLAKWGWFLCPFFPADIAVFFGVLIFAVFAFFFVPVFFVWMNQRQIKKDIEAAQEYLRYCKPADGAVVEGSVVEGPVIESTAVGETPANAFCKNCGAPIPAGMAFCTKCGTKVE